MKKRIILAASIAAAMSLVGIGVAVSQESSPAATPTATATPTPKPTPTRSRILTHDEVAPPSATPTATSTTDPRILEIKLQLAWNKLGQYEQVNACQSWDTSPYEFYRTMAALPGNVGNMPSYEIASDFFNAKC